MASNGCPVLYEPTLQKVTLHAPQPARRIFYASIFGLLWAAAIGLAVQTAGQPYAAAVIENARLDALARPGGRAIDRQEVVGRLFALPPGNGSTKGDRLVQSATRRTGTGMLQISAPPAGTLKNGSRRLARASAYSPSSVGLPGLPPYPGYSASNTP